MKIYAGDTNFKTNICTAYHPEEYYVTVQPCEDSERKRVENVRLNGCNVVKETGGCIFMASRLIIDGNSVYEIDEECEKSRFGNGRQKGQGVPMRQDMRKPGNGPKKIPRE